MAPQAREYNLPAEPDKCHSLGISKLQNLRTYEEKSYKCEGEFSVERAPERWPVKINRARTENSPMSRERIADLGPYDITFFPLPTDVTLAILSDEDDAETSSVHIGDRGKVTQPVID
jgi:hypothetical protein